MTASCTGKLRLSPVADSEFQAEFQVQTRSHGRTGPGAKFTVGPAVTRPGMAAAAAAELRNKPELGRFTVTVLRLRVRVRRRLRLNPLSPLSKGQQRERAENHIILVDA